MSGSFDEFMKLTAAQEADRELSKKFKAYSNHIDIYESAISAYLMVAKAVSSKETCRNPMTEIYSDDLRTWMQAVGGKSNTFESFIDVQPKYIETRLSFPSITLNFNYQDTDRLQKAEKLLRTFFPAFSVPRTFEKIKESGTYNPFFKIGEDLIEVASVEKLSRAKPEYTPGFDTDDSESNFKLPKGYSDKGFNGVASLRLRINQEGVQLRNNDNMYSGNNLPDRGSLLGPYTAYPVLNIEAVFRWPIEFARWVTCTDEGDEFVPFMFFQYMNSHRSAYLAKRTRGGGYAVHTPARVNHLGKIVQMMNAERKQGRIAKIRTNEDQFLILGTGEPAQLGAVLWVPNVNNVNEYMNQIKSCYDAQEKTLDLAKFKMSGVPVLTDAQNEKFTYIRESGLKGGSSDISGLITFSLTGSVALDRTTIYRHLSVRLSNKDNSERLEEFLGGLYAYATRELGGTEVSNLLTDQALKQMGFDDFDMKKGAGLILDAGDFFQASPELELKWMHFHKGNLFKAKSFTNEEPIEENSEDMNNTSPGLRLKVKQSRAYLNLVSAIAEKMLVDLDTLKIGFAKKVEFWRYHLYLAVNYSREAKDLAFDYQDKIDLNTARQYMPQEVLSPKGLRIPNMPGLKKALPHQIECFLDFAQQPEMTMLEADVGGGKGMMGPVQALMYLEQGLIKRPLFLVPGRLVSNWTDEIGKYSEGQVNPFPLTLPIVRRLQRVYQGEKGQSGKPDYAFLKKIIDACPINTFFISSFNFLVADSDIITYANTEAARYYAAEFFRDMGIFDLVVMDESHNVKNLTTRATVASSVVASPAPYTTEMSGTFVANVLTDLVGQAAIANPAALGSTTRFVKRYAAIYTGRSGQFQVSEWRPDAASRIVNDMKPYAKKIVKKKDRWAFFLPKTNEMFHTTTLTENQQNFYDFQLNKQIEELKEKNPALYQKMIDGNEKDQGSIAMGLDQSFQPLEAFLGAPDTHPEFMKIKGLSEDDLTSAKLKETIALLDKHFNGYTDDEGTAIKPSQYKVIIFASRIPTVEHFERRMPERYKKMMATYYAGGEQALEAFKTIPGIKILLAAEMSANTGQNFQAGSRMIRLESLWGPGGQVQAAGRIERPDFANTGRDQLFLDWIVVNKTLDVAKTARLISKSVEKMKYDRQEDPNFTVTPFKPSPFMLSNYGNALPMMRDPKATIEKMFTTLPLIKMNFETFLKVNDVRQLDPYFASYALMLDYQQQQYDIQKRDGLHTFIEITDDMRGTLKGSKKIDFMPRVPNINPANFDIKNEWGYKPVSRMQLEIDLKKMDVEDEDKEDDFNEDNTTYVDINPVNLGDIVDTEFGIGKVVKILKNEVWVDIPGFQKVRVLKACTWLITNDTKLMEIKAALNRGRTFVRRVPGLDTLVPTQDVVVDPEDIEELAPIPAPVPVKPEPERPTDAVVVPEEDESEIIDDFDKEENQENDSTDNAVDMFAYVIDGQPALTCFAEGAESDALIDDYDFLHFASFWAVEIKTAAALEKVMAVLTKKFAVDPESIKDFASYSTLFSNKDLLDSIAPGASNFRDVKQFFKRTIHKRLKKGQVRPYPIAWGKKFFMAFDQISTPSFNQALLAIRNAAIPGVQIKKNRQDDVHVRFVRTPEEGAAVVKQIAQTVTVSNQDQTLDLLRSMKKRPVVKSTRDNKAPPPAPVVSPRSRPVIKTTRKS